MKIHKFLVNVLILITFCTCTVSTDYTSALKHAEDCMNDQPENALTALQNIPYPEQLSNQQYALWCLLITQAQDKCYITHDTDSLINIAVRYFDKDDNSYRKAQAYYCQGRVYTDMLLFDKAIVGYLKAEELVQEISDYNLQAHICNHLADLYRINGIYDKSLSCFKEAYDCYKLDDNLKGEAFLLRDIGIAYECLAQLDSSILYLKQSLKLAESNDWTDLKSSVLNCLGSTYENMSMYAEAKKCIIEALNILPSNSRSYSLYYSLAQLYNKMGQNDSASFYLKKVINSTDLNLQCQSYRILSKLSYEKKEYLQAIQYNEQYIVLRDSIEPIFLSQNIQEIEAKYNFEKLTNDKNLLLIKKKDNEFMFSMILIVLLILLFVLVYCYKQKLYKKQLELKMKDQILLLNQNQLHDFKLEIEENKTSLAQMDSELQLKVEEYQTAMLMTRKLEEEKLQLENSYSLKTDALNREVAILQEGIRENESLLTQKDNELQVKIEEFQKYMMKIQSLEINNHQIEDTYSQETKVLAEEIALLHSDIQNHKRLLAQKEEELQLKIEEFQSIQIKIRALEAEKQQLEETYNQQTEVFKKQIAVLQGEIREKETAHIRLKKKSHAFIQRILEGNSKQMKNLYDKKSILTVYSDKEWDIFEQNFSIVYPDFKEKLNKSCPGLHLNIQRYCCLFVLGIKTAKISAVLKLEPNTVSKYRKQVEEKYASLHNEQSFEDIMKKMM